MPSSVIKGVFRDAGDSMRFTILSSFCRVIDAEELHDYLMYRENEIRDFGFRLYEGRPINFLHRPGNDDDRKCAQVEYARQYTYHYSTS